jgi:hypothetical protein
MMLMAVAGNAAAEIEGAKAAQENSRASQTLKTE